MVTFSVAAITKLALHFWCGDDAGVLPLAEETARYLVGLSGTSNLHLYHMINALSRVWVAPGTARPPARCASRSRCTGGGRRSRRRTTRRPTS